MTLYLDSEFRCHIENRDGFMAVETNAFDGKSKAFIEGYRYVPDGYTWRNSNGIMFRGEMISPAVEYSTLNKAQTEYESNLVTINDMQTALEILGVNP